MSTTTALIAWGINVVLWLAALWSSVICLFRGWSRRRLAARSRSMLVLGLLDAVVLLTMVRALAPPPGLTSWLWVVCCGAVGLGLAGAVRRWSALPAFKPARDGTRARRAGWRALATGGYLVVGIGLVAVLA